MALSFKNFKIVGESVIETFFAKAFICVNSTPVPLRIGTLSKTRRQRQRERHKTEGL